MKDVVGDTATTSPHHVLKVSNTIEEPMIAKSESDKREYRSVVLENQLQVLLISDPETDKAAACLSVRIGLSFL